MTIFTISLVGSSIPFSGRLCTPARSLCFWTSRLLLGHPGYLRPCMILKACVDRRHFYLTSLSGDLEIELKHLSQGYKLNGLERGRNHDPRIMCPTLNLLDHPGPSSNMKI